MRVLFLTHAFPRWRGDAAGSFVHRLARALGDLGVVIRVVAPSARGLPALEVVDGVEVERFRYAPSGWERLAYTGTMAEEVTGSWRGRVAFAGFLAAESARAASSARAFGADVVHAHWWFPNAVAAAAAGPLTRAPLVTTIHGTDARVARGSAVLRVVARAVLARSAAVTTVSSWLASEMGAVAPGVPIEIAPMPVATSAFSPGDAPERGRLLFVGRLNAQKGIAHALRALAAMREPATLDVVGEGPARRDHERLARDLGIAGRVTFHGAVRHEDLPPMYRRAGALVMPSVDEGLGLVAVEGALSGIPVVAFDSGGVRDVVRHGESGFLVPAGDSRALASALDAVVRDPDLATRLGGAGRAAALAHFSPEAAAARYAAVYERAISVRGSDHRRATGRAA